MTLPPWETLTGWAAAGQQRVEQAAAALDPAQVAGPSRLSGWTRGHVLSHLARNADALVNLLTWARTAGWLTGRVQDPGDRAGLAVSGDLPDLPRWL